MTILEKFLSIFNISITACVILSKPTNLGTLPINISDNRILIFQGKNMGIDCNSPVVSLTQSNDLLPKILVIC